MLLAFVRPTRNFDTPPKVSCFPSHGPVVMLNVKPGGAEEEVERGSRAGIVTWLVGLGGNWVVYEG